MLQDRVNMLEQRNVGEVGDNKEGGREGKGGKDGGGDVPKLDKLSLPELLAKLQNSVLTKTCR